MGRNRHIKTEPLQKDVEDRGNTQNPYRTMWAAPLQNQGMIRGTHAKIAISALTEDSLIRLEEIHQSIYQRRTEAMQSVPSPEDEYEKDPLSETTQEYPRIPQYKGCEGNISKKR